MEVASDSALLFLGDLCDHARARKETRGGEWDMLQVRRLTPKSPAKEVNLQQIIGDGQK